MKKFEEGIFSDLRNLKPGVDASLEEPKVSFFYLAIMAFFFSYFVRPVAGIVGGASSSAPTRQSGLG